MPVDRSHPTPTIARSGQDSFPYGSRLEEPVWRPNCDARHDASDILRDTSGLKIPSSHSWRFLLEHAKVGYDAGAQMVNLFVESYHQFTNEPKHLRMVELMDCEVAVLAVSQQVWPMQLDDE